MVGYGVGDEGDYGWLDEGAVEGEGAPAGVVVLEAAVAAVEAAVAPVGTFGLAGEGVYLMAAVALPV